MYKFKAHYIKINDGYEVQNEFSLDFTASALAMTFEDARTCALEKAQGIIRELNGEWFFRLTNIK